MKNCWHALPTAKAVKIMISEAMNHQLWCHATHSRCLPPCWYSSSRLPRLQGHVETLSWKATEDWGTSLHWRRAQIQLGGTNYILKEIKGVNCTYTNASSMHDVTRSTQHASTVLLQGITYSSLCFSFVRNWWRPSWSKRLTFVNYCSAMCLL